MLLHQASINSKIIVEFHRRFPHKKLNALLSYALLENDTYDILVTHRDKVKSVILDSGAWSDNTKGIKTDIDGYISYCKNAGHLYDFLFNLDSDFREDHFSPENLENLLKMEKAGLKPVPVIHSLYSGEIDYYIEKGYPIVALGSSYATRLDDMKFIFKMFEKSPQTKIHVFGTTIFQNLIEVPAYSVDSSSWAQAGAHADVRFWNPEIEGLNKTDEINYTARYKPNNRPRNHFLNHPHRKQFEEYLGETFNFRYVDMFFPENRQLVNLKYFTDLEDRITDEHRKRGFPVW
jgi:hypothetical protein